MKPLVLVLLVLLAACVNPYQKFYQGVADARTQPTYLASTQPLQVYSSSDFNRDGLELLRRGYSYIGRSAFNAGMNRVSEGQLREQAERVGAQVVLVASQYTHTVSGAVPLTLPTTSTTTASGTATVVGSGGSASIYGSGSATTYGSQTVVIPYSVDRADFAALYFVKTRMNLGLVVVPLEDSVRIRLQTNSGVRVLVVVEGTPAFGADVLPGDVLLQMGDDRVQSREHYSQLVDRYKGQHITLRLDRGGHQVLKEVTLSR